MSILTRALTAAERQQRRRNKLKTAAREQECAPGPYLAAALQQLAAAGALPQATVTALQDAARQGFARSAIMSSATAMNRTLLARYFEQRLQLFFSTPPTEEVTDD